MMTFKKTVMAAAIASAITGTTLSLTGCFAGASAVATVVSQTISGFASRGPVAGATVSIYAVNADGTDGALLGTTTTNADGSFSITLSTPVNQMIVARILNGSYLSETTSNSLSVISPINGMTLASNSQSNVTLNLNAVSDMAYARAKTLVTQGTPLASAKTLADNAMKAAYGLSSAPEQIKPSFVAADLATESGKVAMVLAGLDKLATQQTTCSTAATLDALYAALASDISDGAFNGTNNGAPVTLCGSAIASNLGTTQYNTAVAAVSPSVFGLTSSTTDFSNAQTYATGGTPSTPSTGGAVGTPTLAINANNADGVAQVVLAYYNYAAGSPYYTSVGSPSVNGNVYTQSYNCGTSGTVTEQLTDNVGNYATTQMPGAGDVMTQTYSNCVSNQNYTGKSSTAGSLPLTLNGTFSSTFISNGGSAGSLTFSSNGTTSWTRQRSVVAQGSATSSNSGSIMTSDMTFTNLTLSQPFAYTLTSNNARLSTTQNDTANTYQLVGSGTLTIDIPTASINGTVVIPANQTVNGKPYDCASSGTITVQGVGGNVIISINNATYADVGLDINQDGVVDQVVSTGTKACAINTNYLR